MAEKSKTKYSKNRTEGTTIASGKDTHIGDNISIRHEYKYVALALVLSVIVLLFFVSTKINFSDSNESAKTPIEKKDSLTQPDPPKPSPGQGKGKEGESTSKKIKPAVKKPIKKPIKKSSFNISDFINVNQTVALAFFNSNQGELADFKAAIKQQFSTNQISSSDNFFQQAFSKKYGSQVINFNATDLQKLNLTKKINCICQIEEKITYEDSTEEGMKIYTARGKIKVHILNLRSGNLNTKTFSMSGAGMSEPAALESLEEHLLQSKKLTSLNTKQCKYTVH